MTIEFKSDWLSKLNAYMKYYPTDILMTFGFLLLTVWMAIATPDDELLRVLVGVPLLFFVPGYAIVTALFPARRKSVVTGSRKRTLLTTTGTGGVDLTERLGLSLGLSLMVVPLVVGPLYLQGPEVSFPSITAALVATSAVGMGIGAIRRQRLHPDERFDPAISTWFWRTRDRLFDDRSTAMMAVNVLLVASVILAAGAFGLALLFPEGGQQDTSMMLLTENETGSYVEGNYPQVVSTNESVDLVTGVRNEEGETVEYSVVVLQQRVDAGETSVTVRESRELERLQSSVGTGNTWFADVSVSPEMSGQDVRFVYLVYRGDAPADPSIASSYRHTYLWMDVEPS